MTVAAENQPANICPERTHPPGQVIVDYKGVTHTRFAVTDWRGRQLTILPFTHIKEQISSEKCN